MIAAKTSNQAKAPQCAAFVEAMRDAFGADQVLVLYVEENGFKLGESIYRPPSGNGDEVWKVRIESESSAGRAEVSSSSSEARPVAGPK